MSLSRLPLLTPPSRESLEAEPVAARRRIVGLALTFALVSLAVGGTLAVRWPDAYYRFVQEDELLEWSSFWFFASAALLHFRSGAGRSLAKRWFSVGLAFFCLFVALEEISWGQRILGFRPPAYFLEHNVQLELNAHNLLPGFLRRSGLSMAILCYGILLPLASSRRSLVPSLQRLRLVSPPAGLTPLFALCILLLLSYPVRFTGEWVEYLFGFGLFMSALAGAPRLADPERVSSEPTGRAVSSLATVLLLALLSTVWSRHLRAVSPAAVAVARAELAALALDLSEVELPERAHGHSRLHRYTTHLDWTILMQGSYRSLMGSGLPSERALFQLDPWNTPSWLRWERDSEGHERALVYSFGPNRMRESVGWELGGDDLGAWVERSPPASGGR